jgi:hypothetical protein
MTRKERHMASPGVPYVYNTVVTEHPDLVMQRFVAATAGTREYVMAQGGPTTLILTRRYIPTWAVVVAILGLLFFLLGLLALLVRETETLTVTAIYYGQGTQVSISGVATPQMAARLNGVLSSIPAIAA